MTQRQKIAWLFAKYPGAKLTAARIAYETGFKLSSVSSVLVKMVDAGQLRRRRGYGPRGGYAYFDGRD